MPLDTDAVALARSVRIESEIARRGFRLRRSGAEQVGPCPVCGGSDRFAVHTRKQVWNCRGCNQGGDVIAMVQHLDACDFTTAVHLLAGTDPSRQAPKLDPAKIAEAHAKAARVEIDQIVDEYQRFMKAMIIWSEAKPIAGTSAWHYLTDYRRLELPPGVSGRVLRFHPECPFGSTTYPCLVALVRNIITDVPQGIHRTALNLDGASLRIDGKTARKAMGPIAGGAIKLTDTGELTTCLGVGEGIESVVSMRSTPEFGPSPIWSLISDTGVRDFPVLAGIECLWIAVDNDKPDQHGRSAGNEAALACSKRWRGANRTVFRMVPDRVGEDLNDVRRRGAA
jgi:putative DNA primase/helicase